MSKYFNVPLVGGRNKPRISSLLPIDDTYMRRPDETTPKLFQLLPDSAHIPPAYTLAGAQSEQGTDDAEDPWCDTAPDPSHAVTALYTANGQCEYQPRVLACRLCLLDDAHKYSANIAEYHESKVTDEFSEDERQAYTDWVDHSFTQTTVNGFDRTVFTIRKPIVTAHIPAQQQASRPVLVMAFALQSTPWGCIETGAFFSPNPEPGAGRTAVTDLADTLTNRADRLPQPTATEHWPLLCGYDRSPEELAEGMKPIIAELTKEPGENKPEPGAVLTNLLDRFEAEYGVKRPEAHQALRILREQGAVTESEHGLIQLD